MDPISIIGTTGKAAASAVAKKFSYSVLERWAKFRAERFFDAFVEELNIEASGFSSADLDHYLDEILKDDVKSEVLFDAYRKFCFAASKTFGPRVIGLLTGRLVAAGRMADDDEEMIFAAAETFSDGDFADFYREYYSWSLKARSEAERNVTAYGGGIRIVISERGLGVDAGPFAFHENWGRWAAHLKRIGLISETISLVTEETSPSSWKDPAPHQVVSADKEIYLLDACKIFFDLVTRCFSRSNPDA